MKYFLNFILIFCPLLIYSQRGHYFLSHHSPGDERIDPVSYDMAQDNRGLLYFATKRGILQFDGKNWDLISGKGAVYSIEINPEGRVFWAGVNGFGVVDQDQNGEKSMKLLSPKQSTEFYQAIEVNNAVYFLNDESIFIYRKDSVKNLFSSKGLPGSFTFLFELFDQAFVSTDQGLIYRIEGNDLKQVHFDSLENLEIIFSVPSGSKYIVGTSDSRLFICSENLIMKELKIEENAYLKVSVIVSGVFINKNLMGLGTLRGGVVFINPEKGSIEEIVDYNTGLPDNEVYSLMTDQNQNIWVAHDYGFTSISPYLPYRSFSHYDGLKGNLLCAITYEDEVYVGTSLGLFKLVKENVYDEIVYFEDVWQKRKVKKRSSEPEHESEPEQGVAEDEEIDPSEDINTPKKKKGFLGFLRRKRDRIAEPVSVDSDTIEIIDPVTATRIDYTEEVEYYTEREKKVERILRESYYAYKKIENIDAKITHLLQVQGKLIASGLAGAFEIDSIHAKPILEAPVRGIYSTREGLLIASTYGDKIRTFKLESNKWNPINLMDNLDDQISFIFEGRQNELWLCGLEKIHKVEIDPLGIQKIQTINFPNPKFSKTMGMRWKDKIILVNAEGFFQYDYSAGRISRIDSLANPKTYFSSAENFWFYDDHSWNVLGEFGKESNTHLLNIHNDVRFISGGNSIENFWLITGNNELYKFFNDGPFVTIKQYPLYLKSITQGIHKISMEGKLIADQEEGVVIFEVAQPNYVGPQATEYRYYIKGINDTWSDWTTNSKITFPYLPPGPYALRIQSRDLFGMIQEMDPIRFRVQPPFWKSGWFYAMEFSVFVLLVMLSFKLSIRYRIVSRLLSLLTIILLIEFIQTMVGYSFTTGSSPILDFIVQVLVAFTILPIEGFLRNVMSRSMGSKSKLYDVISEMDKQKRKR